MAAQHRMSTRRGLPDQGSRGSSHGPSGFARSGAWSAGGSSAAAVGSSVTALRYTCEAAITNRPAAEAPVKPSTAETYLAPETAGRMAAAAVAFGAGLDEAQRYVLYNDFELDGTRREWSYLPEPARAGLAIGSLADAQRKFAHR